MSAPALVQSGSGSIANTIKRGTVLVVRLSERVVRVPREYLEALAAGQVAPQSVGADKSCSGKGMQAGIVHPT